MRTLYARLHVAPLSRHLGVIVQGPARRLGKGNSDVAIGFCGEESARKTTNPGSDELRR